MLDEKGVEMEQSSRKGGKQERVEGKVTEMIPGRQLKGEEPYVARAGRGGEGQ